MMSEEVKNIETRNFKLSTITLEHHNIITPTINLKPPQTTFKQFYFTEILKSHYKAALIRKVAAKAIIA